MPSDPAEHFSDRPAGRPLRWAAGFVVLIAAALLVWWLLVRPEPRSAKLPSPRGTDAATEREQRVERLLDDLAVRLGTGTAAHLAAPGSARRLAEIDRNVHRIGFSALRLRFVDLSPQRTIGSGAAQRWVADVDVTWQFRRFDPRLASLEVPVTLVDDGRRALFADVRPPSGTQVPLWLLQPLHVRAIGRTLALAPSVAEAARLSGLARTAVPVVRAVLPRWRGSLVVEAARSERLLDAALGVETGSTTKLAGVTATVDGSATRHSPTHVFVNPAVFGRLGPRAQEVVLSHEATHVATAGAVSSIPQWLSEGFADYVALRDVPLPPTVTARQILAQVRRGRLPRSLPRNADFEADAPRLGATYEAAWLACRLLAERYGEARLVAFYRQADADGATDAAFPAVLGTNRGAFTRQWRAYLRDLAATP